jgi:O-glycosyl hydrolase
MKNFYDFYNFFILFLLSITFPVLFITAMKRLLTCLSFAITAFNAFSQNKDPLVFTIQLDHTVQQIRNFGASGCWFSEEIGKTWPEAKKQRVAERLFSRDFDNNGQPKGIGLSAFRYNIGAGTAEQGDSGGIREPAHRVECFLSPNGTYDWSKQQGYTWMLQQAKNYGVENLVAFVNSPPVQFTKNGLGYKLEKDSSTNLRQDKYNDYANFLAAVIKHFDQSNLHFNYISPVNEPQWDWTGKKGSAKQEGSPWTNEEIYEAVKALNSSLEVQKLSTKILLTEAAMLNHLYASNVKASRQVANFWNTKSPLYIGGLSNTTPFVEGHSYFTEKGDASMINTRRSLKDTLKKYEGLEYWQSEYCMLGDGFKENKKVAKRSAIDCALFLAKVIHHDLTVGNATAWHYWNSFEPGPADSNTLYYLIALNRNRATDTANLYKITKNLWALGHYSLFVRPGMYRVETARNDGLADTLVAQHVMISAFKDAAGKKLVVNVINYTTEDRNAGLVLQGLSKSKTMKLASRYVTTAQEGDDIKRYPTPVKSNRIVLPARSISTFVFSS